MGRLAADGGSHLEYADQPGSNAVARLTRSVLFCHHQSVLLCATWGEINLQGTTLFVCSRITLV